MGPLSSTGIAQVTARINTKFADSSGDLPDLQFFFAGYLAKCAQSGEVGAPQDPANPEASRPINMSAVVLHPKSRGYLTLRSANPLDPPLIYANYLAEREDVATLVEGVRIAQRLANTTILRAKYGLELKTEKYGNCDKHK